jgi:hypothetical protein
MRPRRQIFVTFLQINFILKNPFDVKAEEIPKLIDAVYFIF